MNYSKVDIDNIKDFLIKYYKASSWKECVDSQKYGTCDNIVRTIFKEFPNTFNILDIYIDFSNIAIKKINDGDEMYGNHYVLQHGKKIYDFARGANCINGIYVLTQKEDNSDKYDIIFTKEEEQLIKEKYKRNL